MSQCCLNVFQEKADFAWTLQSVYNLQEEEKCIGCHNIGKNFKIDAQAQSNQMIKQDIGLAKIKSSYQEAC